MVRASTEMTSARYLCQAQKILISPTKFTMHWLMNIEANSLIHIHWVKPEIASEKQEESFQRQTTFSSESTKFPMHWWTNIEDNSLSILSSQARDPIRETGRVISKANYLQLWINKIPNALMSKHKRQQFNPYYWVKLEIPSQKREE
jgi:acyl-CoA hydrolase